MKHLVILAFLVSMTSIALCQQRLVATTGTNTGNCLSSPCQTISYALGQAVDGDTISIATGTYPEAVTVSKKLTIIGAGNSTIIDPPGTGTPAISITASGTLSQPILVKKLRLTGAAASYGCVTTGTVSAIFIDSISANGCSIGVGYAAHSTVTDLVVKHSDLSNNSIGFGNFSNIPVTKLQRISIDSCTFTSNAFNGVSICGHPTKNPVDLDSVALKNSQFQSNGSDIQMGLGDIMFFRYNGRAYIEKNTISSGDGGIGLHLRGWDNGNTTPPCGPTTYVFSFLPAQQMVIKNNIISGTWGVNPAAPGYDGAPATPFRITSYTDVAQILVDSNHFVSNGLADGRTRACFYFNDIGTYLSCTPTINPATPLVMTNTIFELTGVISPASQNLFIVNQSVSTGDIDATTGNTWRVNGTNLTDMYQVEDLILHWTDTQVGFGFVEVTDNQAYITPNSFFSCGSCFANTTFPSINRVLAKCQDGWILNVKSGGSSIGYYEPLSSVAPFDTLSSIVTKNITLRSDGIPVIRALGMNGTGKKLFLECNVIVGRGGLLLSAGYIQIGNFDLTIRNDRHIYSITAAADPTPSYVITNGMGRLIQREVGPGGLSTAVFYPIGTLTACLPISVINTGTRDHFGARVFDQVFTAGTSGFAYTSGVVNATWMFDEQTLGGSIIAMALRWKTAQELPSFNRAQCYVSHFDGPTWDSQALGASTITSGYFQRTRAGITNFSPFAVLGSTPLPVEFTSFTVSRDNLEDKIKWSTEREEKLTHFEVQRSIDGYNFVALGKVFPRMNYEFITASTQVDRCYYRIAAIDLDGTINYTEVVEIQSQKTWDFYSSGNKLVFQNKSAEKLELLVDIYSVSGEKVSEEKILLEDHTMRDFSLPAGLFIVSVASYETTVVKKLFIY